MAGPKHVPTLFLLMSTLILVRLLVLTNASTTTPTEFIRASCRGIRYVDLCIHSLSAYSSSIRRDEKQSLAIAALSVSLNRARSALSFVARLATRRGLRGREYRAVRDCVENVGDSVDRLGQSIKELGRTGSGRGFSWHVSNVQTWVSAALTDENTCLDGFAGMDGEVKAAVRRRIVDLAHVTSNGLALVNRFASRHRQKAVESPSVSWLARHD